jgi:DNA-cytosine methyltransferase
MIDLLLGGSPCQGFSFAGKQLNFFDPRSKLFFDFVKALEALKPKYFLLENVKMKKEYEDIITQHLGVKPIEINSALVSAQNRVRLYWTNIPGIQQPKDKGILLKDIIIDGEVDRDKSFCIDGNYYKGGNIKQYFEKHRRQIVFTQKFGEDSQSLNRALKSTKAFDEKANCMTATMYKGMASNGATNIIQNYKFRMLYPIECERLQNLPDNYTAIGVIDGKEIPISNTQRYKMLGNGWTVDVIAHILSFIPETYLHTVVSLFDGISCGQVALERAGKVYNQYYASEIDKYAIQVTMKNYPHTMQLGDVTAIDWSVFLDRLNLIQKVS